MSRQGGIISLASFDNKKLEKICKNAIIIEANSFYWTIFILMTKKQKTISLLLAISFLIYPLLSLKAEAVEDATYYQNYELYLKYQKKEKYKKYKKYKKNKEKYGFDDSAQKAQYKEKYAKYKLYKKDPAKYRAYSVYEKEYKKYKKYKKYVTPYSKYSRYSKYKKYNKSEYDSAKNYGGSEYKEGHDRYLASQENGGLGEATLGGTTLGPEIKVGIQEYTKSSLESDYVRFKANKQYVVKNSNNEIIATEEAASETKIKYDSGGNLKFYNSSNVIFIAGSDVYFEAADENNTDLVMAIEQTNNDSDIFDQYRGKIKAHFYDASSSDDDRIWIINTLPLEQYVWGIGEIAGDGDADHTRTMTTMFRTYGYWKIRWSTAYAAQGFTVVDTSSNQIYGNRLDEADTSSGGYDWEIDHAGIKEAAEETRGKLMMYGSEIALSPYSSWTDGRTRSFEERWGSTLYPWCRSVSDPYGKHATSTTAELEAAGNHMVGLSANGSLNLATDYSWTWEEILRYYFYGVRFVSAY